MIDDDARPSLGVLFHSFLRMSTDPNMKILRTSLALTVALAVGLLAWTGCDTTGDTSATSGKMTLRLTDAPLDSATAVNVSIERIALVPSDEDDGDDTGDDTGDDNGERFDNFVDVYNPDTPQTINLLDFQDSSMLLADRIDVPEGEYSQMRLFLGTGNTVEFEGGTTVDLKTPSAQQSGYKINIPDFEVDDNSDRIDITLDFDASQSVVVAGNSGMYILKPVIRPTNVQFSDGSLDEADVEATGRIDNQTDSTITVETVEFAVTDDTEFEDVDTFDDLTSFSFASVEGLTTSDGTFDALYIEAIEDEYARYALEGELESFSTADSTVTLLGVQVGVTDDTEFDDDLTFDGLQVGNRYEVEFTRDANDNRIATEIETGI